MFTVDNCNSEKGMSYTQYYNRFKNLTCALGMDHSPHETRHTFATLAKEAKVDEYCLKLILGHNIADLTERVYTHRKKEQLLEEIKKIEQPIVLSHHSFVIIELISRIVYWTLQKIKAVTKC